MPDYIVSLKVGSTEKQIKEAEEQAKAQGGIITHRFSLVPGFSVSYPDDAVTTLESIEHVDTVELDKVVTTQKQ